MAMPIALPRCAAAWSASESRTPHVSIRSKRSDDAVELAYASRNGIPGGGPTCSASLIRASTRASSQRLCRAPTPPGVDACSALCSAMATGCEGGTASGRPAADATASFHHRSRMSARWGSFVAPSACAVSTLNALRAIAGSLRSLGSASVQRYDS